MTIKLTPRQRQVVLLKCRGAANKEIALVLGIQEATVKSIVKAVNHVCGQYGVDFWALPTDRKKRIEALSQLVKQQRLAETFGEVSREAH
jgi:FixJ family two-component response regulator